MTLKQLQQEYVEVIQVLEPNLNLTILKENLKVFTKNEKFIQANSWEDLCLPILDVCVDFLLNNIFRELSEIVIGIVSKNIILKTDLNALTIMVFI